MDIANPKFTYQCQQHPDFQVEFLQVDNLNANKKGQNLFYCTDCQDEDSNFKQSNYQLIKHVIKSGNDQILSKWPPVNDKTLLKQLIEISTGQKEDIQQIIAQIEQYFTDLKQDILRQIDICQKKMIQQAQELSLNKTDILNKYQAISKVNELRCILVDKQTDINYKEKNCREIVENILLKKQEITDQLAQILDQHKKAKQTKYNPVSADEIKQQILDSLNNINLFEYQMNGQSQNSNNNSNQNNNQLQLDISLLQTNYEDSKQYTVISKNSNNQYSVEQIQYQFFRATNTVSDIVLQKKTKYIFRIEIQMISENECCYIGLIQDNNIDTQPGMYDCLSCCLYYTQNNIHQYPNSDSGISKVIKGNDLRLSKENEIELRVCIEDQILEVLDYPNYHSKLILQDKYKSNLINHKDLRLYFGLIYLKNRITIKNAFTVNKFE